MPTKLVLRKKKGLKKPTKKVIMTRLRPAQVDKTPRKP